MYVRFLFEKLFTRYPLQKMFTTELHRAWKYKKILSSLEIKEKLSVKIIFKFPYGVMMIVIRESKYCLHLRNIALLNISYFAKGIGPFQFQVGYKRSKS